jgi:DNA-binding NtrC family response regulator
MDEPKAFFAGPSLTGRLSDILAVSGATPTPTLEEVARAYAEAVLEFHGGNKTHAARALGIDRRSLYRRLSGERGRHGKGLTP